MTSQAERSPTPFHHRLTALGPILDLGDQGYVVWSCSPIRDEAGTIHVFFTRVPEGTDGWFKHFRTDAQIVHATAEKPEGPYTVHEVVHSGRGEGFWDAYGIVNPRIYRVGGQYALFYTAYEVPWPLKDMREHIGLLISDDLVHWEPGNNGEPIVSPAVDADAWDSQVVNNAALVQHPKTGELLLYYRGLKDLEAPQDSIGMASAPSLKGPWQKSDRNPLIVPTDYPAPHGGHFRGFEDPCVWVEDGQFRMLVKDLGYFPNPAGVYFESSDGVSWGEAIRGYDYPDDSPQLLFNEAGKLTHLFVNRHMEKPYTGYVYRVDDPA